MRGPWVRLHCHIRNDRRFATMAAETYRRWTFLLMVAKDHNQGGRLPRRRQIEFELRVSADALDRTLAELIALGLVDEGPSGELMMRDWMRSQYGQDNRPTGSWWRALRLAVFERDGYTCQYCGARDQPLECDHIVPVSRGGGDEMDNLTTACRPCNRSKYDRTAEEWA